MKGRVIFMENYTREDIRTLRDAAEHTKKQRGSRIITVIIILIFLLSAVFYIKTSHPKLFDRAVGFITSFKEGTLETLSDTVYEGTLTQNDSGESGEMLRTAETLSFNYLSESQKTALLSNRAKSHTLPVTGAVMTSEFGERTDPVTGEREATHGGIDLAAPKGSGIFAYTSGRVSKVDTNAIYGNCITIDHGDGTETFYAHLSSVNVSTGDTVETGERIGTIGSTGKSTGTHLHFELRINGVKTDPAGYIYEKI